MGTGTTWSRGSVWSVAVVNKPWRACWASGGSDTQQNHATLERRASGVSMLTSPPVAVRVIQAPSSQTKSFGPRLATMTIPAPVSATTSDGSRFRVAVSAGLLGGIDHHLLDAYLALQRALDGAPLGDLRQPRPLLGVERPDQRQ